MCEITTDSWIFVDTCRQVVKNFHNLFSQVVARLRWDTKIDRTVVLWPGYDASITTPTNPLTNGLSNGFTIMFSHLPGGLEDFCELVIPELQRRGLFRSKYIGKTLRENLGLPRPSNKYF